MGDIIKYWSLSDLLSLSMIISTFIHITTNCIISFFLQLIFHCIYIKHLYPEKKKKEANYSLKRYKHLNVHNSIILQKPRHGGKPQRPSTDE